MNTNLKVIGLTRLGIEGASAAPLANAITTWPSKLCKQNKTRTHVSAES